MILVTGGLGFLGSHIALRLLACGQDVVLVDNLVNSNLQVLERLEYISQMYIPFVKLDVRNTPALNQVFEQYPIQAVIHCAGFKSLEESVLKPLEYYNDNISCMLSLLRAMQRSGVHTLVYLSSLAVYGKSSTQLLETESFNYQCANPYVKSLQMCENILQDTVRADHGWKVAILRLSNVAGAFENAMLGEHVTPLPKNILPLLLQVAAKQRDYIELQQQALTTDGTVERSFTHVLDVCEAVLSSLYWLGQQEQVCEAFNIAHPSVVSMRQLIEAVEQVTATMVHRIAPLHARAEIFQLGSVSSKAQDVLHWQPQRDLHSMIEDEWRYYLHELTAFSQR